MTSRVLLACLIAASVNATVFRTWPVVAIAALFLIAFLVEDFSSRTRANLVKRLDALDEQAAEAMLYKARIEGLERKIEEPINGLNDQLRSLRNRMGVSGK